MAGGNFTEFKTGQKIKAFESSFLNALVAMANAQPGPAAGGADTMARPAGTILVLNTTGADLDLGDPAMVIAPAITAADSEPQFTTNLSLEAETATADAPGSFAVAMQPIKQDTVGRMCVDGMCPALVTINNSADKYCDISSTILSSANVGPAQIIWAAGASGPQWCVVRLTNRYGLTVTLADYVPKPYLSQKIVGGNDVGAAGWIDVTTVVDTWQKVLIKHVQPGIANISLLRIVSASSSTGAIGIRTDTIKFDAARHFDEVTEGGSTDTYYMVPAGTADGDLLRWNGTTWAVQTTVVQSVVTDIAYDEVNHKFTKKTRSLRVIAEAAESADTTVTLLTEGCP